jgi:hypothetical protein
MIFTPMDRTTTFFADLWELGNPIDVNRFLHRTDIPGTAKGRVLQAAMGDRQGRLPSDEDAYRLMQARILEEVTRLGLPALQI